jgi:hypothetical protein
MIQAEAQQSSVFALIEIFLRYEESWSRHVDQTRTRLQPGKSQGFRWVPIEDTFKAAGI